MEQTKVLIREKNVYQDVKITALNKPEITKEIQEKWQKIIDATAKIINVPAGLIMRITKENMEVFLRSANKENPYPKNGKDCLGHGLYCETVIGKDEPMIVENALSSEVWKDNPDIKLNMISYFGLPIKWHDGEFFGTICVLGKKEKQFSEDYQKILHLFKEAIETDLYNLQLMENLKAAARLDVLTNVGNRRAIYESIEDAIADYQHDGKPFTVVTFDLNKFKLINDEFGHQIGDKVLKAIATYFKRKIKGVDFIGRLGGDEFLLVLKNTTENQAENLMQTFIFGFSEDSVLTKYQIKISYGISEVCGKKCNYNSLIKSADLKMMNKKKI